MEQLEGSKAQLKLIGESYENQTGSKLDRDIEMARNYYQQEGDVESSKKFAKALELLQGLPGPPVRGACDARVADRGNQDAPGDFRSVILLVRIAYPAKGCK